MRCHASQPIMAGSMRCSEDFRRLKIEPSCPPETSLLARSCNKAERERYFVFGEFFRIVLRPWCATLAASARASPLRHELLSRPGDATDKGLVRVRSQNMDC